LLSTNVGMRLQMWKANDEKILDAYE